MKGKMWICIVILLFIGLAACSNEKREFTYHEPGVYKGPKDELLTKKENQELINRLKLIQTDR
ncbi:MAG: hypothetical protein P8130_12635 [Deltaproteobacteria bacterium]